MATKRSPYPPEAPVFEVTTSLYRSMPQGSDVVGVEIEDSVIHAVNPHDEDGYGWWLYFAAAELRPLTPAAEDMLALVQVRP